MISPEDILKKYWKFSHFRGLQKEVISACLNNEDTCVFFPTGGGKSICFQVSGLLKEGVCIVISPLISLMQDQVQNLNSKGIKSIFLKGGLSFKETGIVFDNIRNGDVKFLYLSPEKLQNPILQERLQYLNVSMVAIDEAHCISQWGHDFRPAFLDISVLRDLHPKVPFMALTATATPRVQQDIENQLNLSKPKVFKTSFKRPNIAINIKITDDKWNNLILNAKQCINSGIVYVRSRKATIDLSKLLIQNNISSVAFHGGLRNYERQKILEKWLVGEYKIVVATTAFGMGIDKADVDMVMHVNLPESLESYYQEIGRAGRDGNAAHAVLVYNRADVSKLKYQFLDNIPDLESLKKIYRKLMTYLQIAYGEGYGEEYSLDLGAFCKKYSLDLSFTYQAFKLFDKLSIISLEQHLEIFARLRIIISHENLFDYLRRYPKYHKLMTLILRNYSGIFDFECNINFNALIKNVHLSERLIIKLLKELHQQNIISLKLMKHDFSLKMLQPREDDRSVNLHARSIKALKQEKINQINAVVNFISNKDTCYQVQLLNYFGEKNAKPCGICSICNSKLYNNSSKINKIIQSEIIYLLEQEKLSSVQLVKKMNYNEQQILEVLENMLEENIIRLTANNLYQKI